MANAILMGLRLIAMAILGAANAKAIESAKANAGLVTTIFAWSFDAAVIAAAVKYVIA